MKTIMKSTFLVLLSLSFVMSCTSNDDNDNPNNNDQQIAAIVTAVQSGTWRISNFNDSGQNETSDFNGYSFTFNVNGSLVASNGTTTVNGTWSVTDDSNSNDDSSSDDDVDFNIFFSVPESSDFEDLNDDWDVVSSSSTRIELIDISGGNGGTDRLTFEKN